MESSTSSEPPRVRFPTDTTPPNQRRLAENDALVELIKQWSIWKTYLCGDNKTIGSTPLGMVTLSIEEEGGADEEVEEGES